MNFCVIQGAVRTSLLLQLCLFCSLTTSPRLHAADGTAKFRESNDKLQIVTERWSMTLDADTGAILELQDLAAEGTLLRGGVNLWQIDRSQTSPIEAVDNTFTSHWDSAEHELVLDFVSDDADVRIVCAAEEDGPLWKATVKMKRGTMLGWRFPDELIFDIEPLNAFIFPEHLGLAFGRRFFEPGGAGVQKHMLGGAGLLQVTGDRCQMRPIPDEAVPVRPGEDAARFLPEWYLQEMSDWRVMANRCPSGEKHDLSLI